MLRYEQVLVRGALNHAIRDYAQITGDGGVSKALMPRPGASLAISLRGSYSLGSKPVPAAAILGIKQNAIRMDAAPAVTDRIHVHFLPCGLSRFAVVPMQRFAAGVVPAEEIFPARELARLVSALSDSPTLEERGRILDAFFSRFMRVPSRSEHAVEAIANGILEASEVPLSELLRSAPFGVRQVERIFQHLTGVSPRVLAGIARFDRARNGVLARSGRALSDIGLDAGYYDQAHFIREFRRHAAMSPGSYSFCALPASRSAGAPQRSFPARSQVT